MLSQVTRVLSHCDIRLFWMLVVLSFPRIRKQKELIHLQRIWIKIRRYVLLLLMSSSYLCAGHDCDYCIRVARLERLITDINVQYFCPEAVNSANEKFNNDLAQDLLFLYDITCQSRTCSFNNYVCHMTCNSLIFK